MIQNNTGYYVFFSNLGRLKIEFLYKNLRKVFLYKNLRKVLKFFKSQVNFFLDLLITS